MLTFAIDKIVDRAMYITILEVLNPLFLFFYVFSLNNQCYHFDNEKPPRKTYSNKDIKCYEYRWIDGGKGLNFPPIYLYFSFYHIFHYFYNKYYRGIVFG